MSPGHGICHRMAGAGKSLKHYQFQPLCHWQGHLPLHQAAQSNVPLYSEEHFEKGIVASYIS